MTIVTICGCAQPRYPEGGVAPAARRARALWFYRGVTTVQMAEMDLVAELPRPPGAARWAEVMARFAARLGEQGRRVVLITSGGTKVPLEACAFWTTSVTGNREPRRRRSSWLPAMESCSCSEGTQPSPIPIASRPRPGCQPSGLLAQPSRAS